MNVMELGAIGELVGGVAVIASLIYVGLQVRQSTALAQATAQRDLMDSFQSNLDRFARDPDTWIRGLHQFSSLSNEERVKFQAAFNPWVNHLEQTLRMRAQGLETQDNIDTYGDICLAWIQEPGGLEIWKRTKGIFFPMSRQYIESRLADASNLPPRMSEILPWFTPNEPSSQSDA